MIISTFKSIQRAYVDLHIDMEWSEIAELLMTHNEAESKKDVELYNMVHFKDSSDPTVEPGRKYHYIDGVKQSTFDIIPGTVRRCKSNVVSLSGIVLDVDDSKTIEETMNLLGDVEYVLYTTFNHSLDI